MRAHTFQQTTTYVRQGIPTTGNKFTVAADSQPKSSGAVSRSESEKCILSEPQAFSHINQIKMIPYLDGKRSHMLNSLNSFLI